MSYQITPLAEALVTLITRMIFRYDKTTTILQCFYSVIMNDMSYQITPLAEALVTLITRMNFQI